MREHFHELGLDPQLAVLDACKARLLADETLDEELQAHYAGQDELAGAVQKLIHVYGGGRDRAIRQLVLRLHHYAQTRPDADGWLARQIERFASPAPDEWREWLSRRLFKPGAMNGCRFWKTSERRSPTRHGSPKLAVPEAGTPSSDSGKAADGGHSPAVAEIFFALNRRRNSGTNHFRRWPLAGQT